MNHYLNIMFKLPQKDYQYVIDFTRELSKQNVPIDFTLLDQSELNCKIRSPILSTLVLNDKVLSYSNWIEIFIPWKKNWIRTPKGPNGLYGATLKPTDTTTSNIYHYLESIGYSCMESTPLLSVGSLNTMNDNIPYVFSNNTHKVYLYFIRSDNDISFIPGFKYDRIMYIPGKQILKHDITVKHDYNISEAIKLLTEYKRYGISKVHMTITDVLSAP